ncbi:MAG: MerR family transcriptional regulator [Chloroflexi bacterium OLB15]|nr:MAG: MerR family transcriptional regulator [Chloroflexi bacterium OLB15]
MFSVGEFSRLGQVSKRLLRYYDEIGLLKPVRIDVASGYRYYSAEQLAELNRILALKELGLSLDQIRRMLNDHISTEEMQGMLLLKKVEIEQQLQAELQRIRKIESRLQSIRNAETRQPLNVVMKQVSAQSVMSLRTIVEDFQHALELTRQIMMALPDKSGYGLPFVMCHDDDVVEFNMDLQMGRVIETSTTAIVPLDNGMLMQRCELPPVETMATTVITGALETIHVGYAEIGLWAEQNGYRMAGTIRELSLQLPRQADGGDLISEIQVPVERVS